MPGIQSQSDPVINLPSLYKYGLKISVFVPDETLLYISPGMCRDSNNIIDIELGSQNVEGIGATQSLITLDGLKNGVNGLDEGTLAADTMYSVYVIADSRYYLPTAGLLSVSTPDLSAVPVIPKGYDSYRLIGYWSTDNSTKFSLGHYQGIGNDLIFWYGGTYNEILSPGSETSLTDVVLTAFCPPIDDTLVVVTTAFLPDAATNYYRLASPVSVAADFFQYGQVAGVPIADQVTVNAQLSAGVPVIQYMVSDGDDALQMWINGFYCSV